jgi:hypothetical protein
MAYQKILVDNTKCSRRFHLTFDSTDTPLPHVEVKCQFCNATIFKADNHPKVQLAREENLVKTASLSENITQECFFEDTFSKKGPQPAKLSGQGKGSAHG